MEGLLFLAYLLVAVGVYVGCCREGAPWLGLVIAVFWPVIALVRLGMAMA